MDKKQRLHTDDGWVPHPETTPEKIDEKYKVKLKNGTETEDYFTGINWYYYDYTEIVAWKPIRSK